MTTPAPSLADFLLARVDEDEAMARDCAEMFPAPWDIADRGWRVRIYAGDVLIGGDHDEPEAVRSPCVIEVEPDHVIDDPKWLAERVAHIARHDPARVLAECAAKRKIIYQAVGLAEVALMNGEEDLGGSAILGFLASAYADHEDYQEAWGV